MKIKYLLPTLVILISCGQSSKNENDTKTVDQGVVEIIETAVDSLHEHDSSNFQQAITSLNAKNLPHIEATNFDSFIEEDYKSLDFKAFKLDKIYPDFNLYDNNFRAISAYIVPISDSFHTVVITVQKNENEMETVLINYDREGEILTHQIVSYDEIAEGWSQVVSRISENKLTVNRIFWGEIKQIEQEEYILHHTGEIEKIDSKSLNEAVENFALVDAVLTELTLDWIQTKTSLITSAPNPNHPNETIVVIPEIVDEGIQYFDLDAHIVIADKRGGNITHTYFENHETNEWESDAVRLDGIEINTTRFEVSENTSAFELNVSHLGSSRVNPYAKKNLSLFIKSGDTLEKILSNYTIEDHGGEWNGDCDGEFTEVKRRMDFQPEKTNGFFDILVNKELTYTEQFKDKNEECIVSEKDETKKAVLKYNGWQYSEYELDAKLYAEFYPQKVEDFAIDKVHINSAHQLEDFNIVSGYYEPVDGKNVLPDTDKDWGERLFMLDASNEIIYKSHGVGDLYNFEPHFYISDVSDKIIIICQMTFEYPFGGEAFILENGKINHIGTLDIEGYDPEQDGSMYLTEIVEISEDASGIQFSFKTDKLVLGPGTEDEVIVNKNVRYVYKNNQLSLLSNQP